jgi:hypothetical protein
MDGSDDGVLGEVDRLRVGNIRFFIGFKIDDDDDDAVVGFPLVSFGSIGILSRDCLDNEDIRRLAAAIGPIDKQSVRVLVFFSLEFVDSSLEDDSSLLDILNKPIDLFDIKEKPSNKKYAGKQNIQVLFMDYFKHRLT